MSTVTPCFGNEALHTEKHYLPFFEDSTEFPEEIVSVKLSNAVEKKLSSPVHAYTFCTTAINADRSVLSSIRHALFEVLYA